MRSADGPIWTQIRHVLVDAVGVSRWCESASEITAVERCEVSRTSTSDTSRRSPGKRLELDTLLLCLRRSRGGRGGTVGYQRTLSAARRQIGKRDADDVDRGNNDRREPHGLLDRR